MGGFLDARRAKWPRLYFVSDQQLLRLLADAARAEAAEASDTARDAARGAMLRQLPALFPGVARLRLAPARSGFDAVVGPEGEVLPLLDVVPLGLGPQAQAQAQAEAPRVGYLGAEFFGVLQVAMCSAMRHSLPAAVERAHAEAASHAEAVAADGEAAAHARAGAEPGAEAEAEAEAGAEPLQLAQLAAQVRWTAQVEAALSAAARGAMPPGAPLETWLHAALHADLARLEHERHAALAPLQARLRGARTALGRVRLQATLLGRCNERERTRELRAALGGGEPLGADGWAWLRQPRAYLEAPGEAERAAAPRCMLRHGLGCMEHGYEYLGASPRLALAPSTARCQLALLAALAAHTGGVLVGASGVGKTEAARDLGRATGQLVVVVHCSRQLPSSSLGRLIRGAAGAGAWLLLEEVASLPEAVLLRLAEQAHAVHAALQAGAASLKLDGAEISASRRFGLLATAGICGRAHARGEARAGAARLPTALRAQLRPVGLAAPSLRFICEARLLAGGFAHAAPLAERAVALQALLAAALDAQLDAEHADTSPHPHPHYHAVPREPSCPRRLLATVGGAVVARGEWHRQQQRQRAEEAAAREGGASLSFEPVPEPEPDLDLALELQLLRGALLRAYRHQLSPYELPHLERALEDACGATARVATRSDEQHVVEEPGAEAGVGAEAERAAAAVLPRAVREGARALQLAPTAALVAACEALQEALEARPCALLLLGGAGSGKTSCYRVLRHALLQLAPADGSEEEAEEAVLILKGSAAHCKTAAVAAAEAEEEEEGGGSVTAAVGFSLAGAPAGAEPPEGVPVERLPPDGVCVLNPCALMRPGLAGLVGSLDAAGEWSDGALTSHLRHCAPPARGAAARLPPWLVLDAPLHPAWLECIAGLMETSPALRLPSAELLSPPTALRLLLETDELRDASPSMVSPNPNPSPKPQPQRQP